MMKNKYIRICPECGNEKQYKTVKTYRQSKPDGLCCKCASKLRPPPSKETRQRMSNSQKGRPSYIRTDETKQKMSIMRTGEGNPMYGRITSEETKQKLSDVLKDRKRTEETKQRMKENHADFSGKNHPQYGSPKSEITKRKLRLSYIKRMEKNIKNGGQLTPFYNPKGCEYFNQMETGTHIQHAENGGEYHIKELGYWVDGYDEDNNIVYEYDEKHHFDINGNLKEKDLQRQKEITEFLGCEFLRIKE